MKYFGATSILKHNFIVRIAAIHTICAFTIMLVSSMMQEAIVTSLLDLNCIEGEIDLS